MAKGGTNLPPNAAQADRVLSENPNTKKNRERRAKLAAQSGTAFMELKAENANLTALSKYGKRFMESAKVYLDSTQLSPEDRAEIERELVAQGKNCGTAARFLANKHPSQTFGNDPTKTREYGAQDTYYHRQDNVFYGLQVQPPTSAGRQNPPNWEPPASVAKLAKYSWDVSSGGSLVKRTGNTDTDDDMDEEESEDGDNAVGQHLTSEQIAEYMQSWTTGSEDRIGKQLLTEVKTTWKVSFFNAVVKFCLLERSEWADYVYQMSQAAFNNYVLYLNPRWDGNCDQSERIDTIIEAHKSELRAGARVNKILTLDEESQMPVPAFSILFNRRERVVIGALFLLQLNGEWLDCKMKVAATNRPMLLPAPFEHQKLDARVFPIDTLGLDNARRFVLGLLDDSDDLDTDFFISLQDVNHEMEKQEEDWEGAPEEDDLEAFVFAALEKHDASDEDAEDVMKGCKFTISEILEDIDSEGADDSDDTSTDHGNDTAIPGVDEHNSE